MRLFCLGETEIRVNPLALLVVAGAFVLGRANDLLLSLAALFLHELAHAVMARAFGCRIESVELLPFGGMARIRHASLSDYAEFCIAAAGPIASFILGGLTAAAVYAFPKTVLALDAFLLFNLTLALVNLLPALPLDGGRMLRCLLARRMGISSAARLSALLGVLFGVCFLALGVILAKRGAGNPVLPVMGFFLLLSAVLELRRAPEKQLSAFLKINASLRAGCGVPVHSVAAAASMRASEAMRVLRMNSFNVIRIVDASMHTLGELDETGLITGIARRGGNVTVGELLPFDRGGRM